MYVVDMHMGVIQHYAFLSPYLRKIAKVKQLDTIINMGRILKINNKEDPLHRKINFDNLSTKELVPLLKHGNGYIRDKAQHILVYKEANEQANEIEKIAVNTNYPLAQIHALYTLKGIGELKYDTLKKILENSDFNVISHAIVLLDDFISKDKILEIIPIFNKLVSRNDKTIDLYLSSSIGKWQAVSNEPFMPLFNTLLIRYKGDKVYNDAFLSGFESINESLLSKMEAKLAINNNDILSLLKKTIQRKSMNKINKIFLKKGNTADSRTKGAKLFAKICAACHGISGEGTKGLAPPLLNSEYVSESIERLGLVMLHGLEGPVHVNGKLYEMNHAMPGLKNNKSLSNKDIADLISYVTSAFSDKPRKIKPEEVSKLREQKSESGKEYTEEELLKITAK